MHTHPLAEYMDCIYMADWPGVAELMLSSADKLAKAGADFLICPDNTIHQAFDLVAPRSPLPWLHIAEEVANEAVRLGAKRVGVLGTRYLMEGPVYPPKLKAAGWSTGFRTKCSALRSIASFSMSWCTENFFRTRWRIFRR